MAAASGEGRQLLGSSHPRGSHPPPRLPPLRRTLSCTLPPTPSAAPRPPLSHRLLSLSSTLSEKGGLRLLCPDPNPSPYPSTISNNPNPYSNPTLLTLPLHSGAADGKVGGKADGKTRAQITSTAGKGALQLWGGDMATQPQPALLLLLLPVPTCTLRVPLPDPDPNPVFTQTRSLYYLRPYYLLPTTYYLLLTSYYLLPTTLILTLSAPLPEEEPLTTCNYYTCHYPYPGSTDLGLLITAYCLS